MPPPRHEQAIYRVLFRRQGQQSGRRAGQCSGGFRLYCTELLQGGFTHGFVVEFASVEDRDFYVSSDSVHQAFSKKNRPRFHDVRVVDYEKGVY